MTCLLFVLVLVWAVSDGEFSLPGESPLHEKGHSSLPVKGRCRSTCITASGWQPLQWGWGSPRPALHCILSSAEKGSWAGGRQDSNNKYLKLRNAKYSYASERGESNLTGKIKNRRLMEKSRKHCSTEVTQGVWGHPWMASRSNQSLLKEIKSEHSQEGLMMKLKFQCFGHLMRRANSLVRTLMLGKIKGRRRWGWQRIRWLHGITDATDMSLSKPWEIVKDREAWLLMGSMGKPVLPSMVP